MNFAETERTELKQKLTDALPKEIVAFLNTDGGTVYIGVNDDGSICGVTNLDEILKKIADILGDQILPDPRSYVELGTKFVEQKHIIEIKIQKGSGIPLVIEHYGKNVFEFLDFFLRVTIPFAFEIENEDPQQTDLKRSEKWPEKWPEKAQQILDAIRKDNSVTIAKMEKQLGLGHTTVKKMLAEMQNGNFIRRVGGDKGGHWEIILHDEDSK